jgi:hypothetical protein
MGMGIQPKSESCPNTSILHSGLVGAGSLCRPPPPSSPLSCCLSLSLGGIVLFITNHKNISNTNPSHIIQIMNLRFANAFLFLVAAWACMDLCYYWKKYFRGKISIVLVDSLSEWFKRKGKYKWIYMAPRSQGIPMMTEEEGSWVPPGSTWHKGGWMKETWFNSHKWCHSMRW